MDPILFLFLYSETLQYEFTDPSIKKQSPSSPKAMLVWWLALANKMQ